MNGTLTTRQLFQLEMRTALDVAEGNLRQQYNDPDLALEIVDHRRVSDIVQAWPAKLNWAYARQRISAIHRSCFVGLRTGNSPDVAVLAAIRVSRHRVTTSLLFLQKDDQALLPGRAMAMVDVILTAVAAFFGSATIAIDDPFPALVPYYKDYHYVTEIWRDRRRLLSKRA